MRFALHPDVLFAIGLVAGLYAIGVRNEVVPRWRLTAFGGGLLLLLAAHVTPLGSLATTSLLSAHLLQNVVFAEWAPALLVLGIPGGLAARLGRLPGARVLTYPVVALLAVGRRRTPSGTCLPSTTRRFAISRACSTSST